MGRFCSAFLSFFLSRLFCRVNSYSWGKIPLVELQLSVNEAEAKGIDLAGLLTGGSTAPAMCISKLHTADHIGQGVILCKFISRTTKVKHTHIHTQKLVPCG